MSKFLRPYSFWWILFEMLFMGNVQFFSFLGFRSLDTSFSFDLTCRWLVSLSFLMLFFITVGSIIIYPYYYSQYGKLARYFLSNMFRFRSSYILMVLTYGIRPLLKGFIHAILYEHWEAQIYALMGT